jgi:hypothetical protein
VRGQLPYSLPDSAPAHARPPDREILSGVSVTGARVVCRTQAAPDRGGTAVPAVERHDERRAAMSKRGRKRRARKKSGANHGKRPNA